MDGLKPQADSPQAGVTPSAREGSAEGRRAESPGPSARPPKRRGVFARADLLRWLRRLAFSRLLGLCLLIPLIALRIWDPAPLEILRLRVFDLYQLAHPRQPAAEPIVIVDIDEESLAEIGQWPWPRLEVARMIERLRLAGVVAVGFDITFPEPDRTSPGVYADSLADVDPAIAEALRALPNNDEVLAGALSRTRVVLGQSGYHREVRNRPPAAPSEIPLAIVGADPKPYLYHFPSLVRNTPVLEQAAASRAVFNLVPGSDGVVRNVPPSSSPRTRSFPAWPPNCCGSPPAATPSPSRPTARAFAPSSSRGSTCRRTATAVCGSTTRSSAPTSTSPPRTCWPARWRRSAWRASWR